MINKTVYLDVTRQSSGVCISGFTAGDEHSRALTVILTDGEKKLLLPNGTNAELFVRKPDGSVTRSPCTADALESTIRHTMTVEELSSPGRLECALRVQLPSSDEPSADEPSSDGSSEDGGTPVIFTPRFDIIAEDTFCTSDAPEAADEGSVWTDTLERIRVLEERADAVTDENVLQSDYSGVDKYLPILLLGAEQVGEAGEAGATGAALCSINPAGGKARFTAVEINGFDADRQDSGYLAVPKWYMESRLSEKADAGDIVTASVSAATPDEVEAMLNEEL